MRHCDRVQGWIKRNDRREVDLEATLRRADGRHLSVRITNISYEGCQLNCSETLPIGETLRLSMPGLGNVGVQVRWAIVGKAGLKFLLQETQVGDIVNDHGSGSGQDTPQARLG